MTLRFYPCGHYVNGGGYSCPICPQPLTLAKLTGVSESGPEVYDLLVRDEDGEYVEQIQDKEALAKEIIENNPSHICKLCKTAPTDGAAYCVECWTGAYGPAGD